jgi:hypothetical protein
VDVDWIQLARNRVLRERERGFVDIVVSIRIPQKDNWYNSPGHSSTKSFVLSNNHRGLLSDGLPTPSIRSCLVAFFMNEVEVEVEVKLRPMASRPVCLGVGLPSGPHDPIFVFCLIIAGFLMWGTLSDERTSL